MASRLLWLLTLLPLACAPAPLSTEGPVPAPSETPQAPTPPLTPTPAPSVRALTGTVTTLPGRFEQARDVAVDASGNLYVASSAGQIDRVAVDGTRTTLVPWVFEGGVFGLTVGPDGTVHGTESFDNRIVAIAPGGEVTRRAGTRRFSMRGLAADARGNLYVAEEYHHRVSRIAPDGTVTVVAGYPGGDDLSAPADAAGYRDAQGVDARFKQPVDVAIDSSGSLFVADAGNKAVRRIDPAGHVTTVYIAQASESPAPIRAVAVDAAGTVYLTGGNRIGRVGGNGEVTWLAGDGTVCRDAFHPEETPEPTGRCMADGTGREARFFNPSGLAFGGGRLYVADDNNHAVRVVE